MTLSYIVLLVLAALATAKSPLTKKPKPDGNVNAKGPAPDCGQSPMLPLSAMSTFIVGGTTAESGDIPWQVGVYKNSKLWCGGSYLLSTTTNEVKVATAAHCIEPGDDPSVYAALFGMHDLESLDGVQFSAKSIVLHTLYDKFTHSHDVAIMSFGGLSYTALAKTYASPICLVSKKYTIDEMAIVSGWGHTSQGGEYSRYLQYARVLMVDHDSCKTKYTSLIDTTMLCAAENGKDACKGDSGGPLAVYRDNKWQLAGIVSWGRECADEKHPGVYADVYNMRTWIGENL